MKSKLLSDNSGQREWVIIFDPGDEVMSGLNAFVESQQLRAARFTGIGAFADVTVAWFNNHSHLYIPIQIKQQVEVISLIGDVAELDGKPSVHAHVCVGKSDGTAHGGHLQSGYVRPTLEVVLTESPAHLRKTFRPQFGLPLIDLDESTSQAQTL